MEKIVKNLPKQVLQLGRRPLDGQQQKRCVVGYLKMEHEDKQERNIGKYKCVLVFTY